MGETLREAETVLREPRDGPAHEEGRDSRMMRVAIYAIVRGNYILAEWREDGIFAPGNWSIPGGKIECDESTVTAMLRELREEIGKDARSYRALTPVSVPRFDTMLYPFLVRVDGTLPDQTDAGHHLRMMRLHDIERSDWEPAAAIARQLL